MFNFKKFFTFSLLIIMPLALTACIPFGPRSGGRASRGVKGVFKSVDKGTQWQAQNTIVNNKKTLARYDNHQISFDIFDSHILYRATNVGLFISDNAGESWRQIYPHNVDFFVLNPKTRGLIYVVNNNQLFKTTGDGQNWQLVYSEAKGNIKIKGLAISHFDTSYIYLLTSEGIMLLSTDWGDSWQVLYNFVDSKVKKLYLNPHNSQLMFVAAERALYRSQDGGHSWINILDKLNETYPAANQFRDLIFGPTTQHLIYLSRYGVLISHDSGDSWQPLPLITPVNSVDISAVAYNSQQALEYYYIVDNVLYHSVDGGHNWETKLLPLNGGVKANQLLIDPKDSQILYLSAS